MQALSKLPVTQCHSTTFDNGGDGNDNIDGQGGTDTLAGNQGDALVTAEKSVTPSVHSKTVASTKLSQARRDD